MDKSLEHMHGNSRSIGVRQFKQATAMPLPTVILMKKGSNYSLDNIGHVK
jgi:hypothetical protein